MGLVPSRVKDHFKSEHKDVKVNIDQICQVATTLDIPDRYPEPWKAGPYPEVAGLKISSGLKCPDCTRVGTSAEWMRKMYPIDHPDNKGLTPKSWIPCHVQRLHPTAAKQLWWAKPASIKPPSTTEQILLRLHAHAEEWLKIEPEARDARAVSPWLLANQWHLYIGNLDKPTLARLVSPPGHGTILYPLAHMVKEYFSHCEAMFLQTDVLVLQYLNSPNPSET